MDVSGNLFIADTLNNRIRRVDAQGIISTVAGNGSDGFSGDGGPAMGAELYNPSDVVLDVSGNLFIADSGNHRIRKVDHQETITTVAGNGSFGFSGDGGPAVQAELFYPGRLAVDVLGNLFIVEVLNRRIRKVFGVAASVQPRAGDLTGDDQVNADDVQLTLRIYLGLQTPTLIQIKAADVRPKSGTGERPYGDGRIASDDVNWIVRAFLGLEQQP